MLRANFILFYVEKPLIFNLKNTRKITYCDHNIKVFWKTTYKFMMKALST
jgi:hypothetical protein